MVELGAVIVDDLLRPGLNEVVWAGATTLEMDPLREEGALQDAQD